MTAAPDLLLVVAAALVDADGRVLIAQRPEGKSMAGLWEFPGGKIEAFETPEWALIRELREELGIVVKEPCLAPFTFASHNYGGFHLLMPLYICRRWEGEPRPLQHAAIKWIRPRDLMQDAAEWSMPAADLPLLPMLRDLL
jgi:8-oxo-dGTP diphosphatase